MNNEFIDKEKKMAIQEKNIAKTKWQCMCPGCSELAINSHLLQRHGVLSHITEKGHLYEMGMEDFFKWHENDPMKVKKVGLQQAISYPLFCNKHDTELFAPIEGEKIDFNDYYSQLLFSYRGLCAEIRKKEFVNLRNVALEDGEIKNTLNDGTSQGLKDLQYYKFLFEQEIIKPNHKFAFFHHSYPLLKVCASGSVSYEPVNYDNDLSITNAFKKKIWDGFFINVIPQETSLEIIIGYHKNHANSDLRKYVESWAGLTFQQLQVKLTDLFTARLETWCMSPTLYESMNEEKKEWLMKTVKEIQTDFYYDIRNEQDYNLFA